MSGSEFLRNHPFLLCPAIIETGSLSADQSPDSEMNHRISGIICQKPADRQFQSEQDTGSILAFPKTESKSYPELFTNPFFTVNTGRHQKLSFAAVFSYKQNNQQFICQKLKRVNNADYKLSAGPLRLTGTANFVPGKS
ncbi:MAG: hypothetical protein V2I97_01905 [Desulfococcaceae bacterium]|jgi:hypothetical protein|nr:hypothetical protein [Desulfococcaceae bacterium]